VRALGWLCAGGAVLCLELVLVLYASRLVTLLVSAALLLLVSATLLGLAEQSTGDER
jgi:hypothetical protein